MDEDTRKKVDKVLEEFKDNLRSRLEGVMGAPLTPKETAAVTKTISETLDDLAKNQDVIPHAEALILKHIYLLGLYPPEERIKVDVNKELSRVSTEALAYEYLYGFHSPMHQLIVCEYLLRKGDLLSWKWKWKEDGSGGDIELVLNKPINYVSTTFQVEKTESDPIG